MQPQFVTKPAFTVVGVLIHTKPMARKSRSYGDRLDHGWTRCNRWPNPV